MINDILQVSSAPHVDGRGQVVDSSCAALLPSTSQFQVLRAMADEGRYPWMSKNHHGFFCCKALLHFVPPLSDFILFCWHVCPKHWGIDMK